MKYKEQCKKSEGYWENCCFRVLILLMQNCGDCKFVKYETVPQTIPFVFLKLINEWQNSLIT